MNNMDAPNLNIENHDRQLIPRWIPSEQLSNNYVMRPFLDATDPATQQIYLQAISEWETKGGILAAIDLVGIAYLLGIFNDDTIKRAASYVINNEQNASNLAIDLAQVWFDQGKKETKKQKTTGDYAKLRYLKKYVIDYPQNPIAWLDRAYYYALLGQQDKAYTSVRIALNINSSNTYLLRSASRFYVYYGTPDVALFYLRKADNARNNPQILAAEISIAEHAQIRSRFSKIAKLYTDKNLRENSLDSTELFAAVATMEYKNGKNREGAKLLRKSLIMPNENSLSQAVTFQTKGLFHPEVNLADIIVTNRYEADSWLGLKAGDFVKAYDAAIGWYNYQPICALAAIASSYIASVALRRDNDAIDVIKRALCANPHNNSLNNNLAFSYANINDIDNAEQALNSIDLKKLNPNSEAVIFATTGLVEFRKGRIEKAREYYRKATDFFQTRNDEVSFARASLFWGREEARIHSNIANDILDKSEKAAKKHELKEVLDYINFVKSPAFFSSF